MQNYKRFVLGTGLALVAGAFFVGWRWHPAQGGFAVVELFTSEGCSSCPPAEALMAQTQQEDKDLPVYCLAFHVDYWDHQGWKDVYSNAAYTDRQRQYSRWLRLNEMYTPQAVVNGTTEFVGSNGDEMTRAIQTGLGQKETVSLTLTGLRLNAGRLDWQYKIDGLPAAAGLRLTLVTAVVEKNAVTQVKGGENSGRTLSQAQIVRNLGMQVVGADGSGSGHIDWPAGLRVGDGEVIAFLQDQDNGKIIAATRVKP